LLKQFFATSLLAMIVALPFQGTASENSAVLSSGQTTHDGALTLVVVSTNASTRLSLQNNALRPVMVRRYALGSGLSGSCDGGNLLILANSVRFICALPSAAEATVGHASLQVSVTWQEAHHASRNNAPSPGIPVPSP
jgi:hypothetical protein